MPRLLPLLLAAWVLAGCRSAALPGADLPAAASDPATAALYTLLSERLPEALLPAEATLPVAWVSGAAVSAFAGVPPVASAPADRFGSGETHTFIGTAVTVGGGRLERTLRLSRYDAFPGVVVVRTTWRNTGSTALTLDSTAGPAFVLVAEAPADTAFWSFQGASYGERPDWVLPVGAGFARRNFQGMNASDYGGGTPVIDVWTRRGGLAVGHLDGVPRQVALPVAALDRQRVRLGLVDPHPRVLAPGAAVEAPPVFVAVHRGDFFAPLTTYAALMARQGLTMPPYPATAYEPVWCAWGYGRHFDTAAVLGTLPMVKQLGLPWVGLDDGWQVTDGDWDPHPDRFPGGEADMRAFVERIHAEGLRAVLWWLPLAADPDSRFAREHPEWFLLDADGRRQDVTWWDAHYLCPALPEVRAYTRALIARFVADWGYDGLKIDGQNLNAVAPCYNPAHHHDRPEASVEAVPAYFRDIYETAVAARPDAVVQLCPCGAMASFFNMPFNNQPVASDPTSSWQVRTKGKTFKALMGPRTPYFGDHVELSTGGDDFASTLGVGGVPGTKFTWAPEAERATAAWMAEREPASLLLTDARARRWQHWLDLYRTHQPARGVYQGGLYDIGFDRPEGHAIAADDGVRLYAFFADAWDGPVELRGLADTAYTVRDYENDRLLGTVAGPVGRLPVVFRQHLLLEARPVQP